MLDTAPLRFAELVETVAKTGGIHPRDGERSEAAAEAAAAAMHHGAGAIRSDAQGLINDAEQFGVFTSCQNPSPLSRHP